MASSIQLLRSTIAQERPFPNNLLEGQPAVNLNASEPGLFFKAADGSLVKFGPAAITSDGSPPNSSPQGSSGNTVGELWLDKSTSPAVLKVYDGAAWVDAGSGGGGGGGGSASFVRWIYTSTGGETSLSGTSNGVLLDYTPGLEEVFVNGVLITRGLDYSATNGSSITNLAPLTAGDVVTITSINPLETVQLPGQVTLLRWTVLATAGQTILSGIDSSSQQLAYTAGFEEVYVNGAFLRRGLDYTATSGSSITLAEPLELNDEVTVMAWSPFEVGETTPTAPQNIISVFDFMSEAEIESVKSRNLLIDVTDTVQAAIDSVGGGTGNKTLYFPDGRYRLDSDLSVQYSNITLVGNGENSELYKGVFGNGSLIQVGSGSTDLKNITIRGLGFNGEITYPDNATTQSYRDCRGVTIAGKVEKIYVEGCTFRNFPGVCLNAGLQSNSSQVFWRNNYFENAAAIYQCMRIQGPSPFSEETSPSDCQITGNVIYRQLDAYNNRSADGIMVNRMRNVLVSNNTVIRTSKIGIRIEESSGVSVVNNVIEESGDEGIVFYKFCEGGVIDGNVVKNWGRRPPFNSIRNYNGKYIYFKEFPWDRPGYPPLPADPTTVTWAEEWPYDLSDYDTSLIPTYSDTDYFEAVYNPVFAVTGILPFRGYAAISVNFRSKNVTVSNNFCKGSTDTVGGKPTHASNWGFSIINPRNGHASGSGEGCRVIGNVFLDCSEYDIYHPNCMDPINGGGCPNKGVHYISNTDNNSLIDDSLARISNVGTVSIKNFSDLADLASAQPSPPSGTLASVDSELRFFNGSRWETATGDIVSVRDFGATGDGTTDDTAAIQAALDTGKDIIFPKGEYIVSATLNTIATGSYPVGYGQTLYLSGSTIRASSPFTGTSLINVGGTDCGIIGGGFLECENIVDYAVSIYSQTLTRVERIRCYSYNIAGIYVQTTYGQVITSIYGGGNSATAEALVLTNNTTGVVTENIQNYRRSSEYLIKHNAAVGFAITGGSADKSTNGIFLDQSMGVVNSVNFEGTKYPLYVKRSMISANGCRFLSWGGNSLCPENSTNAVDLNIGTAATRRAGSYILRGLSARVFLSGCWLSGGDAEYDWWFTDFSAANSNSLTTRAFLQDLEAFSFNFPLTMQLDDENGSQSVYSESSISVLGAGSGQNNIHPSTVSYSRGIDITDDGTDYTLKVSGLYEIQFSCAISAASTATSCTFELILNGSAVKADTVSVSSGFYSLSYFAKLAQTHTVQIVGESNGSGLSTILENPQLSIKRVGNY